jgi:uncharacterized iron-regulated membrane protein
MFRKIVFWLHLVAGLIAGLAIGIMCFTGVVLAFEKQLVAWAERDARRIEAPAPDAARLTLTDLTARVRTTEPEARPQAITVSADPRDAVAFSLGRDNTLYAHPFTGEVRRPASETMHDFMHVMTDWHRWLALGGDHRPIGKAINGAGNLAFFALALTGLYLWWPRSLSWRGVRAVALFNWRLTGKARDFNWHNSLGLWAAPVLIVLTLTALPISYRWAANGIYHLTGEEPPAQAGPGGAPAAPAFEIQRPTPDARPLDPDALLAIARTQVPDWSTLTLRLGNGPQRGAAPASAGNPAATERRPAREAGGERSERRGPQAATIIVRTPDAWPRTATTTLSLHPFTGEVLRRESFADLSAARQIRSWTRFLHTGEALGWPGQLVAGLASLVGCVLVYTGFALSWRRFFPRRRAAPQPAPSA